MIHHLTSANSTAEENEHGLHIWSAFSRVFQAWGMIWFSLLKTAAMFPYQFSSFYISFTHVHFSIRNIFKNCTLSAYQVIFFTWQQIMLGLNEEQ